MGTISIIELAIYGFFAYGTLWVLISSITKPDVPMTLSLASLRIMLLMPGVICAGILASVGVDHIQTDVSDTGNIIKDLNNTNTWQETTTHIANVVLINPVWILVHYMIFTVLLVYVFVQIVNLLTKKN